MTVMNLEVAKEDWRHPLIKYFINANEKVSRQIKYQTLNYVIMGYDLFNRAHDGMTLLYISQNEQMKVMDEVYESICGAYQAREKMR